MSGVSATDEPPFWPSPHRSSSMYDHRSLALGPSPEAPPRMRWLKCTELDLEAVEGAAMTVRGNHHHVDELEEGLPREADRAREQLDANAARAVLEWSDLTQPSMLDVAR